MFVIFSLYRKVFYYAFTFFVVVIDSLLKTKRRYLRERQALVIPYKLDFDCYYKKSEHSLISFIFKRLFKLKGLRKSTIFDL